MSSTPIARARAGFAPAGMFSARTFPSAISSASGGSRRRSPGTGRTAAASSPGSPMLVSMEADSSTAGGGGQNTPATCGWSNSERKTLIPSTIEARSLASSAIQSWRYPPLDGLELFAELVASAAPGLLRLVRDAELRKALPEFRIESAGRLLRAGHPLPGPVLQCFGMADQIVMGDDGTCRAEPGGELPGHPAPGRGRRPRARPSSWR